MYGCIIQVFFVLYNYPDVFIILSYSLIWKCEIGKQKKFFFGIFLFFLEGSRIDGNEIALKQSDNKKINTATGIIARSVALLLLIVCIILNLRSNYANLIIIN